MGKSKEIFGEMRKEEIAFENKVVKKTLFNITEEFLQIEKALIESGGEIDENTEKTLAINKQDLYKKSEGYVSIINKIDAEVNYIDNEIKRLQNLKKIRKNIIERLKASISNAMTIFGIKIIELQLNKISFRKSKSVSISCDIQDLPDNCKIIKVEPISKTEIRKMIESGTTIEGVEIIEKKSLQIK